MVMKLRKFAVDSPILATAILVVLVELVFHIDMFSWFIPDSIQLGSTLDRVAYTAIWMLFILYFMKNNLKETGYSAKGLKEGMKIGIWVVLLAASLRLVELASNVLLGKGHFMNTPEEIFSFFDYLLFYLSVGLFEETVYRAIPVNILRNKTGLSDRAQMFYCVVISSLFFGLVHLMNMVSGGDTPVQAIGRAISCIGTGMLFGAIYWRTGSLLTAIIVHALWDGVAVFTECLYIVDETSAAQADSLSPTSNISSALLLGLAMAVINVLVALFIMRKKKCTGCKIEAVTMREQFFSENQV